jgi:hypothetical protein
MYVYHLQNTRSSKILFFFKFLVKADHNKNGVTNHRVKNEWKKKPEHLNVTNMPAFTSPALEHKVVNGWDGPGTAMKRNTSKNKCADCGANYDENHLDSDEHLFAVQYKKFTR